MLFGRGDKVLIDQIHVQTEPEVAAHVRRHLGVVMNGPRMIVKDAYDAHIGGRGASLEGVSYPSSIEMVETHVDKRAKTTSDSTCTQMCDELEEELDVTKLECQLCRAMRMT